MHYFSSGETLEDPSMKIKLDTVLEHYDHMIEHYGVIMVCAWRVNISAGIALAFLLLQSLGLM